jgi:hypothetical protein
MVAVPAVTPVTSPVASIVATVTLLLLHEPPVPELVSRVVIVSQTVSVPEIVPADGNGLTVIVYVDDAVPQPLVTA